MEKTALTRRQVEAAIAETAWQWYLKGVQTQYDNIGLLRTVGEVGTRSCGGPTRANFEPTPEDATSNSTIFTVCSDYIWNVYNNAIGYPMFGTVRNSYTMASWVLTEHPEDMVIARWWHEKYPTLEDMMKATTENWGVTKKCVITEKHRLDREAAHAFVRNWKENLRVGDILLGTGHVEIHIGGGWLLDSNGKKYNMETGIDRVEPFGTVHNLHRVEAVFSTGDDPASGKFFCIGRDASVFNKELDFFAVIRPLDALMLPGGTDDPGDDLLNPNYVTPDWGLMQLHNYKKSGFTITPATASRLKYPGMEIDRTVSVSPYGTAVKGETLRYSVKITNHSADEDYSRIHSEISGTAYDGEDYVNLVVREKVPAGTKLNRALGKATVCGDDITWTVNIPAGGSLELVYFVDVVGEIGTEIVSDGGFVADIPSNRIINRIGGKRLNNANLGKMFTDASLSVKKWFEYHGVDSAVRRMDFVKAYYDKILGLNPALPSVEEMVQALFEPYHFVAKDGFLGRENINVDCWYLHLKEQVAPEYQRLKDMLVRGYLGGQAVYTNDFVKEPRLREVRDEFLEPGDILVHIKLNPAVHEGKDPAVEHVNVMLQSVGGRLIGMDDAEGLHKFSGVEEPTKAFTYDIFFALRPRQVYEDINTL